MLDQIDKGSIMEMCNCEAAVHMGQYEWARKTFPEHVDKGHAFMAVPATDATAPFVGPVCDECRDFNCMK